MPVNYGFSETAINGNDAKKEEPKAVSFEEALEIIGFGKIHIQNLILGGLILMAVLNETLGMGVVIPAAKCDLQLTTSQTGIFSSVAYLGIVVSSHFWGYTADTRGRRKLVLYTVLLSNLCTVLGSFSFSFPVLITFRFLTGFFISACSSSIYAYIGEFNTVANRATVISWASSGVGVSYLYVASTGWLVSSQNWSIAITDEYIFKPWRFLLIIYMLPGFCGALWLIWMPESPKFLMAIGRDHEALGILTWIYQKNTKNPADQFPVKKLVTEYKQPTKKVGILESMWDQTRPLLRPPHAIRFFVLCFLQLGAFAVACGLGLWYPEIMDRLANTNSTTGQTICELLAPSLDGSAGEKECTDEVNSQVFINTLAVGGLYVFTFAVTSFSIKSVGRGNVLTFCFFGAGICGVLLQWLYQPIIVVMLFCIFLVLPGIAIAVTSGGAVALFPTTLRAMAVGTSLLFGRLSTVIVSNFVGRLLEYSCDATFWLFTVICFACGFANFLLPTR